MNINGERVLLRIYLLSTDHILNTASYVHIVTRARKRALAGATVLRGIYGYGKRGIVVPSLWHISNPTPVVVEIVDAGDAIARFLNEEILPTLPHGCITLERAAVLMYRPRTAAAPKPPLDLLARVKDLSTLPDLSGSPSMTTQEDGILLRIFAGESDTHDGKPLYQAVVHKARELGLAGATVLKGAMGFGANSALHTANVLELSTDLPILIELVDSEANIRKLLPALDQMVHEGMITMESVRVVAYRHNPADHRP